MSTIGPNTCIDANLIASDVILCCGEDPEELLQSLRRVCEIDGTVPHSYRGFGCLRLASFSVVWGGIGTGALEPLLWELFESGRVRRIVLIGTAGVFEPQPGRIGKVYALSEAFLAGTALDESCIEQPLRPVFRDFQRLAQVPSETIVSTDFYYGFAGLGQRPGYPDIMRRAKESFSRSGQRAKLVDMEAGQFYFFCDAFRGEREIEYLAIKGAANSVAAVDAQVANSAAILVEAIAAAVRLLGASGMQK
jgi:hypothetical protein